MTNRSLACVACLIVLIGYPATLEATETPAAAAVANPGEDSPSAVDLDAIFAGGEPSGIAELKEMQRHQQGVADRLLECTVGVVVGPAHGSGVIVSAEGYVLTAAHVAGASNRRATLILSDGRRVSGRTLGVYRTLDAGLLKIDDAGPWPHAKLSDAPGVEAGQWVITTGHPGGYQAGRKPVFRVGRVLEIDRTGVRTDCPLIGGDSGGPLFDMQGAVIGINSRIGRSLTMNVHVPVAVYRDTWERLTQGHEWGHFIGTGPYIGVQGDSSSDAARVARIQPDSPADEAGLQTGDIIIRYSGKPVTDFTSLQLLVCDSDPGDTVRLLVQRGNRTVEVELTVGNRKT